MTKDKMFKWYCVPLLGASGLSLPVFLLYDHYYEYSVYLLFSAPVLFLLAFIPWVIVDGFDLLEWER